MAELGGSEIGLWNWGFNMAKWILRIDKVLDIFRWLEI
jgi:hypothetical protein